VTARIPALDGFRGYAILGIVTLHVLGGLQLILLGGNGAFQTIAAGTVGEVVDCFFIISGFTLFHRVIQREGEVAGASSFYRRRATRIYPAYWLSLVFLLVAMAIYLPPFTTFPGPGEIGLQFSGLQMPSRLIDSSLLIGFGVNGAIWFVSVILGFYVVFPLIARRYYRHPLLGLAAAALVSILWKESAAHMAGFWDSIQTDDSSALVTRLVVVDQFPGWAFSFGAGMTAAWAYTRLIATRSRAKLERDAVSAAPLVLVLLAIVFLLFGQKATDIPGAAAPTFARQSTLIPIVWSAAVTLAMLVVLVGPRWMRRPFTNRPVRALGDLSYGIFLIHAVFIVYLASLFPGWATDPGAIETALFFIAVFAGSIAYAIASRRLVEQPVARWASSPGARVPVAARP
jgi:peptidoglycan/LPS O-acetylase OafA/YrhL